MRQPISRLLTAVVALGALSSIVLAPGAASAAFRKATETEIRQQLDANSELKPGRDGYEYKPGSKTGYKISNGKICVLLPNLSKDCVRIITDGTALRMIDRTGARTRL